MSKLSSKKDINFLTLLCAAVYFVSYISRINLGAVLVEVVNGGFADKKTAALALTVCSVTYGAGQLISGYLGDKFKPQNIIFIGFFITAAMNISVGALSKGGALVILWAINGFAQALMWPPLVKILSSRLSDEAYKKAVVKVSWGSSMGTIAVYLLAPVIIKFLSVKLVFIISGALAVCMAFIWKLVYEKYKPFSSVTIVSNGTKTDEKGNEPSAKFNGFVVTLLISVMFAIVLQGALRDGVTNWTPSYISDMFKLDSSVSILTGVILPVFSILSFSVTSFINRKIIKNEIVCAGAVFAIGAISATLLVLLGDRSVILSLLLLALLVGCMHGVNLILVCMIPAKFSKFGKVSFISGLINSSTYLGAAISTYGIAIFTDEFGWTKTIILWSVVAYVGALVCILLGRKWSEFKKDQ
ncbi:MAG: MFS transporter [Ruminococcaceae bacterium]|nr:MFS transporter [Oscillospiraceae bacterium]